MIRTIAPDKTETSANLAAAITWKASKQTFYTIRLLVDRAFVADAFRAYAYFRWLDDCLDVDNPNIKNRIAFVNSQMALLEGGYQGVWPRKTDMAECMLRDLIQGDVEKESGLHIYLREMMAVMAFDAQRRGHLISQEELNEYTRYLATAVTEGLHHFVGHGCGSPEGETRYLAVSGAHIVHMLRDTIEDIRLGYYNIPIEFLNANALDPQDVNHAAYRRWVESRVQLARSYFAAGKKYLAQVESLRCRLAGYAYIVRFEGVLSTIERDRFVIREDYPELKSAVAGLSLGWSALMMAFSKASNQASNPLHVE
ncbi:MAG: squalene/phytoene synthase family protein [Chloroflexi bacterium]|nr:squalene/phytoene synthase family protein [Chloroflexota bacterium]